MLGLALLVMTAACGGKGGASPEAPDPAGDPVADVLRAVEQWRTVYESRDLAAMSQLYDHGEDVTCIAQGKRARGWSEVENQLHGVLTNAKEIHLKLDQVQVSRVAPGATVVTATAARDVSDGVTTVTEAGAVTLVLRFSDGRWLITSEHYSYGRTP
jgi:uncharacterized protein (TIGR02246 family)